MPDILTHIAFAQEALKTIDNLQLKKEIEIRMNLFRLGAQGPDIFFYHKFFSKKDSIRHIGSKMHAEKTGDFLQASLNFMVENNLHNDIYYDLMSYILGFLSHYVLDKNVHPYVYRLAGYCFEDGFEKGKFRVQHKKMENHIDVFVWNEINKRCAYKQPVHKLIYLDQGFPTIITTYLEKIIKDIYREAVHQEQIEDSYNHILLALKFLYDPKHIKKKIIQTLGNFSKRSMGEAKPLYTSDIEACKIYMNLEKKIWTHPLDENIKYNLSFMELFNQSIVEYHRMINKILEQVEKKENKYLNIIGNKSYLTNLEYHSKQNYLKKESKGLIETGVIT